MPSDTPVFLRLRCPTCQQMYRVKNGSREKSYLCQKCKVPMGEIEAPDEHTHIPGAQATVSAPQNHFSPSLNINAQPLGDDDLRLEPLNPTGPKPTDIRKLVPGEFDGYRVLREIARGGMGAVLLAEQMELRRTVAMKIMLPWAAEQDQGLLERFIREGRAMAKLKHPHIIDVYGVGSVNGVTYLTMEYIAGQTLSDLFDQRRLSYQQMAIVISKVARALAFAHSRGVIHRDIKPANIMLRDNGEPVLMDFGLAKDAAANSMKLSMTGNIMGTPSYMSPEQAQGKGVTERSDVYSLGAVLYEGLTHQTPFSGETTIATIYNLVHNELRPAHECNPTAPLPLSRICSKSLEKEPSRRYPNMDEFAGDLDRFREGMDVAARGPSVSVKAADWARKNTPVISAIAVAIVAVILLGSGLKMGWLRPGVSKADELRQSLTGGTAKSRLLHIQALAEDLQHGQIKAGSPEAGDAFAALRLAAADVEPDVSAAAVTALGEAGDKSAEQIIREQLDPKHPIALRRAAITAFAKLDTQSLSTVLLKTIKTDPSIEVKLAAVDALHDTMGPDVMISMLEIAAHGEPVLASACTKKLSQLRPPEHVMSLYTGGNGASAGKAMSDIIRQNNENARQAEALLNELETGSPETKDPKKRAEPFEVASKNLLAGPREQRLQAAYDLGILADSRSESALVNALNDEDTDVALTAAISLGKLQTVQNPQKLADMLKSPNPAVRQAAARAYGLIRPTPPGQPLSDALLAERQNAVQAELAKSLGNLKYSPALAPLTALLSNGSGVAVQRAAWALGRLGDKQACNALVDALGKAGKDTDLKEEIAGALSALTGQTIGTDEAKWREVLKAQK